MKRLLEFLQKLWGKAAVPALLLLLAVLIFPPMVSAQYGGSYGCSPGYCHPSYGYSPTYAKSYGYRNQWSAWTYGAWGQDPSYYIFYRTWYDHCGTATNHNDGYLYTRYWHGGKWCYERHCLISAYAIKVQPSRYIEPRGATEVGYYEPEYELVKRYPVTAGLIAPKNLPGTIDPRSLLAPLDSQAAARQAFVEKSQTTTVDMALKIAQGEQAKELEQIRGRNVLAREIQAQQNDERFLAEIKEFFAVRRSQSVIDGNATPRAIINVNNPALASLIQDRCISCHGPTKAEAGLNFSSLQPTDFKSWQKSFRKCATGEMPKGGEPLTDDELDLFDEQYQLSLKAR